MKDGSALCGAGICSVQVNPDATNHEEGAVRPGLGRGIDSEMIAAKIVAEISEPVKLGGTKVAISVNLGVCTYPEGDGNSERLLQSVDAGMYTVKSPGRNEFHLFRSNLASTSPD